MDLTRAERDKLAELAELAYARELQRDLVRLADAFAGWRAGRIGARDIDASIHDYVRGASRDAYQRYTGLNPEAAVARAVALHLVKESELPEGLRGKLEGSIRGLRDTLGVEAGEGEVEGGGEEGIGAHDPGGEELAAIRDRRDRWIAAINDGSATDFVDILTDDAVWLPPGHDAIRGKEKIRTWLEEPFATFDYDYSVSGVSVRVAGDWAVEKASFSTRARAKDDEAMPPHEGQYTLLWRKTSAGTWSIERYIDHSANFVRQG